MAYSLLASFHIAIVFANRFRDLAAEHQSEADISYNFVQIFAQINVIRGRLSDEGVKQRTAYLLSIFRVDHDLADIYSVHFEFFATSIVIFLKFSFIRMLFWKLSVNFNWN